MIWQVNKVKNSLSWKDARWPPEIRDMEDVTQDEGH
jgi:hypothetical protein